MGNLFRKFQSKRKKGFTLLEVLVVIIILGVLTAIAVPTYNKVIKKSRVSDGLHVLDMLAGAQEKYFIEHGHYAEYITELNAPFKETRIPQPGHEFRDIVTTNFRYTKNYRKHCIEATSNINGENYTLVKNYKSKDKVVCRGTDCSNIADYVGDDIGESAYGILCPDEVNCNTSQEECQNGTHFFWDTCECDCSEEAYQQCVNMGGIYSQSTCSCGSIVHIECEGEQPTVNQLCPTMQGDCNKQACNPCVGTGILPSGGGNDRSGSSQTESCCGWQLTTGNRVVCNHYTGQWQCINDTDPCNAVSIPGIGDDCDGTDVYPEATPNNTCGVKGPGQCFIDHLCDINTSTYCNLKDTSQCFDGQTRSCTLPGGGTGIEHCVNCHWNNNCEESPCPGDQPSSQTGDCGSTKATCEQDENGNWNWVIGFIPANPDFQCDPRVFPSRPCPDNPDLVQLCTEDCMWGDCEEPASDCSNIPYPTEIAYVPDTSQCKKYERYICIKNEQTNQYEWQPDPESIGWSQPNYNCITGMPPILCPNGLTGGAKGGGAGGGKGIVDPSSQCSWAGQCDCLSGCDDYLSDPEREYCIYVLCGGECEYCNGGSGGGGGGSGGYNFCEKQNCPPGEFWYPLPPDCGCRPIPGGMTGSGEITYPYQYCENCVLSDCTFCNPADRPNDWTTSCGIHKSECWEDAHAWVEGKQYYQECISNNGNMYNPVHCSHAEWFGDNNCETGQWKFCSGGGGRQYCNDCHWGDCVLAPYHIETITGLVDGNGNAFSCNGTVSVNSNYFNSPSDQCENNPGDTYDTCEPADNAACSGGRTSLQSCGNITNYNNYCNSHSSGTVCVISGDTPCPSAECIERGCPNNPMPDYHHTEPRNCSRTLQILHCD